MQRLWRRQVPKQRACVVERVGCMQCMHRRYVPECDGANFLLRLCSGALRRMRRGSDEDPMKM